LKEIKAFPYYAKRYINKKEETLKKNIRPI